MNEASYSSLVTNGCRLQSGESNICLFADIIREKKEKVAARVLGKVKCLGKRMYSSMVKKRYECASCLYIFFTNIKSGKSHMHSAL